MEHDSRVLAMDGFAFWNLIEAAVRNSNGNRNYQFTNGMPLHKGWFVGAKSTKSSDLASPHVYHDTYNMSSPPDSVNGKVGDFWPPSHRSSNDP
jgi:hypothetical protein